jgi:hypothetical protein
MAILDVLIGDIARLGGLLRLWIRPARQLNGCAVAVQGPTGPLRVA